MDTFDVIVIGGGPGGYVAAIRAAQLGLKTACIDDWSTQEGKPSLGGTCLNVGCIPSKAMLDSSHQFEQLHALGDHGITVEGVKLDVTKLLGRKDQVVSKLTGGIAFLFKNHHVTSLHGRGRLVRREGESWIVGIQDQEFSAKNVILATGSVPRPLALAPFDGKRVVDNAGALAFTEVPRRFGIIGAGVIGLELGSVWRRFGSEVTILEVVKDLLPPSDRDVAKEALRQFKKQGLDIRLGVTIEAVDVTETGVSVRLQEGAETKTLEFDRLMVGIGRIPNTRGLGAEAVGLKLDDRGFIETDGHLHTNLPNVYAIGDVIGGAMLAHKAEEEGIAVAERLAGKPGHVNYDAIPWVIYTSPEIAWVGKTEQALKDAGIPYRKGTYSFTANGRALAHNDTVGFVKILADEKTDRVLGVHMIGPSVSELVSEGVTTMEYGGSAEDIARTMHAHPTLSEVTKEAARAIAFR